MKKLLMIKNIFPAIFLSALCLFSPGCVYLVVGSIGAVGGYVVSPDTVEGTIEKDFEDAWAGAVEVLNDMGHIVSQHEKEGRIEAIVNNARVNVTLTQFTNRHIKLSVKARKSFFPNIANAQEVYVKILNQL